MRLGLLPKLLLLLLTPPHPQAGLRPLLDAVLAAPAERVPRQGLADFARAHGERYAPPPVHLPAQPTGDAGAGITITIDGNKATDPLTAVYFSYSVNAAAWRQTLFHRRFPRETVYRGSLAEERAGIRALLSTVRRRHLPAAQLDPTLRTLQLLQRDGMLSCWILLDESTPDHPVPGLARDYPAYRAGHRALLRAYLLRYDLHRP